MTSGDMGAALVKKTHPIRGILWGIPFGLGLAVVLVLTKVIPLEQAQVVGVFFGGLLIGLLWSLFGPAKKPKGAALAASAPAAVVAADEPETPGDAVGMYDAGTGDGADQADSAEDADDDSGGDETGDDGKSTSGY